MIGTNPPPVSNELEHRKWLEQQIVELTRLLARAGVI